MFEFDKNPKILYDISRLRRDIMLGNVLKLVRLYNEVSVNSAASHLNMLPKQLKKIENGKAKVFFSTLGSCSELYQMPISQILILNDMQEHFKVSDAQTWEDIERFYVCKKDEVHEPEKTKSKGCKNVSK